MFLNEKYVLANELIEKMGIHIANISMLRKRYECSDHYGTVIKMNNCTFLNSRDQTFPNNIKQALTKFNFTSMTDKLPCTWVRCEYKITEHELKKLNIIIDKIIIAKKQLYVFHPEFVKKMQNKMGYVLSEKEALNCHSRKEIDGYTELSKNKYFVWY